MLDWLLEVILKHNIMYPTTPAYTDVVELCAMLQCLGFSVKSLNTSDGNVSQESGARTVIINCQASGLHVVLESGSSTCSCPAEASQHNSGVWQVSGIAGGQRLDKEFGCSILRSLPKAHRERLSKELQTIMHCIMEHTGSDVDRSMGKINKSASMVEINVSPDRRHSLLKAETPTHYRSLDTLTATNEADQLLPTPGLLQKELLLTSADEATNDKRRMCRRQSTYTLSPPGSLKVRSKTSSPIQQPRNVVLENLIAAEKAAEALRNKISAIIKQCTDEEKDDSSISSLALDVSKISLLKVTEPLKTQFASSPNLSSLGTVYEDMKKNKLMKLESSSSSSLVPKKQTPNKDGGMTSKLRRLSPGFFKSKNISSAKNDILKPQDNRNSKLTSIFKPKAVTPKLKSESSPNLSASKKRFSHVKSTIPKPTPKKN